MKRKWIIRIRGKNEFNRYWAFLLSSAILFAILSFRIKKPTEVIMLILVFVTILVIGILYQGFEATKE